VRAVRGYVEVVKFLLQTGGRELLALTDAPGGFLRPHNKLRFTKLKITTPT
jgi:hypothetical protein